MSLVSRITSGSDLAREFAEYDRADNFSHDAVCALYDYLEELEELGDDIEIDIIGLCVDWTECTLRELVDDYSTYEYMNRDRTVSASVLMCDTDGYIVDFDSESFIDKDDFLEEIRYSHSLIEVNNGNSYLISG
jgi:hypothetical protein